MQTISPWLTCAVRNTAENILCVSYSPATEICAVYNHLTPRVTCTLILFTSYRTGKTESDDAKNRNKFIRANVDIASMIGV